MKKVIFALALLLAAGIMSSCSESAPAVTVSENETAVSDGAENTENTAPADIPDKQANAGADVPEEAPELFFGAPSGFYKESFELEIFCSDKDAEIRFTKDGSVPDASSELYTKPIKLANRTAEANMLSAVRGVTPANDYIPRKNVDKANVIRAAAVYPDGTVKGIISGTFFVGIDREEKYGNLPVISLFTDTANLFNPEKGIYILGKTYEDWLAEDENNKNLEGWQRVGNYSNRGREWERPVTVEYFTPDGKSAFVQDMGFRVMGAASRSAMQKSFRFTARADYGKKSLKYEIIPDNERSDGNGNVEKYKSFVLRNGGNDCDFAKVRDPFLQQLVPDRRFETEQFTPCVAYLDGEYWGMYTLGEDYSDNYIENNYGIDNNSVIIVKRGGIEDGEEEDISLYNEMHDFIVSNDMGVDENYEKAGKMLDMGSFADYCAFNLYIYNEDSIFKDNNWEMWRVRDADGQTDMSDGKWRMLVYDVDFSSGIYCGGSNYSYNNISEVLKGHRTEEDEDKRLPADIFRSLCKNKNFRRELINALCDIRNINFERKSALEKLNDIYEVYGKVVPDTFRRFGPDWVAGQDTDDYFSWKISELASFIDGRYEKFPEIIEDAFELNTPSDMTLSISDEEKGAVRINSSGIEISGGFKGIYFPDHDIELTAVPKNGGKFVRWEYSGCTVSDETSEKTTVKISGDFSITAVFE